MCKYIQNGITSLLLLILLFCSVNADRVFKYPRVKQEKDNWCWDACSQWILGFHGVNLTQTDICKYGFTDGVVRDQWNWIYTASDKGDAITSNFQIPPDWDWSKGMPPMKSDTCYGRGINIILDHFGVPFKIKSGTSNPANYTLTEDEFKNEIDNGHPFIVRYNLDNGGGHFVVAMGYQNKMCWLMNPWKDDGIQIYNFQWVMDGSDPEKKHHTWDYTLQTLRNDTLPDLVAEFPLSINAGTKVSVALKSKLNGRDVTLNTFFTSLTEGVVIDTATKTISWTQTEQGPNSVDILMEYGNARDTIVKVFNGTAVLTKMQKGEAERVVIKRTERGMYSVSVNVGQSGEAATVSIVAADGTLVCKQRIEGSGNAKIMLGNNRIASGVYLISITGNAFQRTEKIMLN